MQREDTITVGGIRIGRINCWIAYDPCRKGDILFSVRHRERGQRFPTAAASTAYGLLMKQFIGLGPDGLRADAQWFEVYGQIMDVRSFDRPDKHVDILSLARDFVRLVNEVVSGQHAPAAVPIVRA